VIELQPNCHAAQKQRTEQQQLIVHASIHGVINRLFLVSGQIEFCERPVSGGVLSSELATLLAKRGAL
jgi:hypothetical protein